MKFFKGIKNFYFDNMKLVNKFWINQIAMSIFGIMVCGALSSFGTTWAIVASALSSFFFAALLYDNAWDEGFRDRNRVTNGRLKFRPFHGAKIALFAYIPTLIFLIPAVISTIIRLCGKDIMSSVEAVCKAVILLTNGTYFGIFIGTSPVEYTQTNGVTQVTGDDISMLIAVACLIPAVFAYLLGYRLGLADKQIKTVFGAKPALSADTKKAKDNKNTH